MDTQLRRMAALIVITLLGGCASQERPDLTPSSESGKIFVNATDSRISFSDGLHRVRDEEDASVHFDRVLDGPNRGFRWNAPGARMRWRTNSETVRLHLRYTDRHTGSSRNSVGVFRVDGQHSKDWSVTRPAPGVSGLWKSLPADGAWHDYEIVLPYGDSVELLGVEVGANAAWEPADARPEKRILVFGDSVTHGFGATDVTRTYAFQLAEGLDMELLNLGIGGRGTRGADGDFLAGIEADVITLLIGVNDWQGGADLESFRRNYEQLLSGLRRGHPTTAVYVITPLWVPPSWQPKAALYPLEAYRQIIREVVAAQPEPEPTLIEGPSLIDHQPSLFDFVAVHPNDAGFAQMSERLLEAVRSH